MGNFRVTGITILILMIALFLIGLTVADVLIGGATDTTSEQDLEKMTEEVVQEISTYIEIKDQKGKFVKEEGIFKIKKIALWISPLVTQEIELSQLTIQIDDGNNIFFLYNDGLSDSIFSYTLFEHPIWENITGYNFGLISICDLDKSIINYNIINENSDNAYLIFKIPNEIIMKNNDELSVTLFPSSGITRTTTLKAPMPIKSVVTFE